MKRIGIIVNLGLLTLSLSLFAQGKPELKLDVTERKVNMTPDKGAGRRRSPIRRGTPSSTKSSPGTSGPA